MVANTKAIGKMTRPMATADLFILMVTVISETGSMIKLMVEVHTNTWMEQLTVATGKKTNNMATVKKNGPISLCTKVSMTTHPKRAKASTAGPMATDTSVRGKQTCSTGKVYSCGLMTDFT